MYLNKSLLLSIFELGFVEECGDTLLLELNKARQVDG